VLSQVPTSASRVAESGSAPWQLVEVFVGSHTTCGVTKGCLRGDGTAVGDDSVLSQVPEAPGSAGAAKVLVLVAGEMLVVDVEFDGITDGFAGVVGPRHRPADVAHSLDAA
jgi:hypothetical protein